MSANVLTLTLDLSWPVVALWPNRRQHWRKVAAARKAAKQEAFIVTLQAMNGWEPWQFVSETGDIPVRIIGHRPAQRGQDRDNFQAALKASLDGIAEALGVNDKRFAPSTEWGDDLPPDGLVRVLL